MAQAIGASTRRAAAFIRSVVAFASVVALVVGIAGCTPTHGESEATEPSLAYTDESFRVEVSPETPIVVVIPGLGRITGPSGAFSSSGTMKIAEFTADLPGDSVVTTGGPGVDVTFENTDLLSPLTILFDDPAIATLLPGDALPLVLHRPDGSPWEARTIDYTPDGVPYIVTADFSPNVFSWIEVPDWVKAIPNKVENFFGGVSLNPRSCDGGEPSWSTPPRASSLVNVCLITNTDKSSGAVRAEVQVQNNRQFFQWVSVPEGADYTWVDGQNDLMRRSIGALTGRDSSREILLGEDGWLSAGFQRPESDATKEFRVYSDGWSTAFDILDAVLGLAPNNKGGWVGLAVLTAQCRNDIGSTLDFLGCAIKAAAENLADPNTAFAAAMNVYGERAYAEEYSAKLQRLSTQLKWLGRVVKAVGVGVLLHTLFVRLLDWGQSATSDRFNAFDLYLVGAPKPPPATTTPETTTTVPPPPPPAPPQDPTTVAPQDPVDPTSAPPPTEPTNPQAWVTREGDVITYHWANMPAGMWPEVDRFRCWRYTRTTHPGGWATDGCGYQAGYAGYPSGSGAVSFSYSGANDSFSIEPWKYGPWLNVGESWNG